MSERSEPPAEIRIRAEPFPSQLRETALPRELGPVVDIAAVSRARASAWLILAEDGAIARLDADAGAWSRVASTTVPVPPDREPRMGHVPRRRLHASPDGRFAAVVNDYGRHGQIIDLRSGTVTATLDGGDYHPETLARQGAIRDRSLRCLYDRIVSPRRSSRIPRRRERRRRCDSAIFDRSMRPLRWFRRSSARS
jgi:hypothetical protein